MLKAGDKVTYIEPMSKKHKRGIVSTVRDTEYVWVVYNCGGDWDNYKDYTGALSSVDNLKLGWRGNN